MTKHITITVSAAQYADFDDCLAAAAEDYVSEHPEAEGYDMDPRWEGGDEGGRKAILLDVPAWIAANDAKDDDSGFLDLMRN